MSARKTSRTSGRGRGHDGGRDPAGDIPGVLVIKHARLPDLDDPADAAARGYYAYGRFARLRSGGLWFGDARSSHPATTIAGWYWAVEASGAIIVSARGSRLDGEELFSGDRAVLAWLLEELEARRIIARPHGISIETD